MRVVFLTNSYIFAAEEMSFTWRTKGRVVFSFKSVTCKKKIVLSILHHYRFSLNFEINSASLVDEVTNNSLFVQAPFSCRRFYEYNKL